MKGKLYLSKQMDPDLLPQCLWSFILLLLKFIHDRFSLDDFDFLAIGVGLGMGLGCVEQEG